MRIIFVRHGDPNYELDTLTETGWAEADALVPRMEKLNAECGGFKQIYVSSLGRAKDTAKPTLEALGLSAIENEWMKEFPARINRPDTTERKTIAWDWLPKDWTSIPDFYDPVKWMDHPTMKEGGVDIEYKRVIGEWDKLIASHGYVRCDASEGNYYNVVAPNSDTIVIFCHLGAECVMLSRLLHVSPMTLWHNFFLAPTSVTTVYTEERREGVASFRVSAMGDVSHLYAKDLAPSFSGRFCELYTNMDERHD